VATAACCSAGSPGSARLPAELPALDATAVITDPAGTGRHAAAWPVERDIPMWLHLDVDVLDPAVTYPQAGGPDLEQLAAVLRPLTAAPALLGVSIAGYRPDLDPDGAHAARLVTLLDRIL
jgi:arginase